VFAVYEALLFQTTVENREFNRATQRNDHINRLFCENDLNSILRNGFQKRDNYNAYVYLRYFNSFMRAQEKGTS